MILSIIVPHKDSSALLERLLMSIPSNDEFEVIVVDDNSKKCEKEILIKNIKHLMGRIAICLVPFVVMAVTFALISWEEIASIGMILFWAIIIMIIYNTLMLVLKIFESNNENEKNKKESNHDSKKADNK